MNNFTTVFIGLGSNLNDPAEQINGALNKLAQLPSSRALQCAPWYSSKAIGPEDQPDYINTVVKLETTLAPEPLLDQLQSIEKEHGRQRNIRWGARTLDLDILLFGENIIHTDRLEIPHPEMSWRGFVLKPLFDLAPTLVLPKGYSIKKYLTACDTSDLRPLKEMFVEQ